jgi:hypothetical protein
MPAINEDLWPDLDLASTVTPLSILREQAGLLGKRTRGALRGEVETWSARDRISHSFNVVVPSLGGYKYTLFQIHHYPAGYPVYVDMTAKTLPSNETVAIVIENPSIEMRSSSKEISDESAFRNWLRITLHSDEVKRIIENLYAQAST